MPSFNQTVMSLRLYGKLPMAELKDVASAYVARGMAPEAALQKAVEDRLTLSQMEERRIVQTVRGAYEKHGGKPRPVAPAAQPEAVPPAEAQPAPITEPQPAAAPQPIATVGTSDAPAAIAQPEPVLSADAQPAATADPDQPGVGTEPAAGVEAEQPAALIPAAAGTRPKTEKEAKAMREKRKADHPRTEREAKARRAQVRTG